MNKLFIFILPFLFACTTINHNSASEEVTVNLLITQKDPDFATEQKAKVIIRNACGSDNYLIKKEGTKYASHVVTNATWFIGNAPPPQMIYFWNYVCIK